MIKIKLRTFCVLFIILLTACNMFAQSNERTLLSTYIDGKAISGKTLSSLVSSLAKSNKIPIGLEPENFRKSSGTENSEIRPSKTEETIQIKDGTLENVLNQITAYYSDYDWRTENGVVIISPKKNADIVINDLLNTEIGEIIIEKRVGIMNAGEFIAGSSEIKNKLDSLGITEIHFYDSVESLKFDPDSPQLFFVIKNNSVKSILNQLVRESNSKFWTIVRWGNKGEFLTIVVS